MIIMGVWDLAEKKKQKNEIVSGMMPTFALAGGAMGASVLGGAFQSHLPAGTTNPLTTTGSTLGRFVGPVAAISAGGIVFKELNKTRKKLKGRNK